MWELIQSYNVGIDLIRQSLRIVVTLCATVCASDALREKSVKCEWSL